jgi:acetyl esterase
VSNSLQAGQVDCVDPDIRRFTALLNAAYAVHARRLQAGLAARREVAELVRRDWSAGGPEMAETLELTMDGLRLRLHRPVAAGGLPAMLYVHGGGWTLFSIDTHDRLMREYAARAGIVVIGIDYSLSPESRFPGALEEVSAALCWIAGHAAQLGVDSARLVVGGDSAGANLSVAACLLRRDRGLPLPAGMLLNYGAFSPEVTDSYRRYDGPDYFLEVPEMEEFWANYIRSPADLENPLVAPLRAQLHGLPPAFLAIAECDILTDCNHALAGKLARAGVAVDARVYAGATHSFLEAMSISPLAVRALDDQAGWLRALTGLAD